MSKKNKLEAEKKVEKKLYIKVDEHTSRGSSDYAGDGSEWSAFTHEIIHVNEWGPCYFSNEGKGWRHHEVRKDGYFQCDYRYDKEMSTYQIYVDEDKIPENQEYLFFVIARYGDGGTFGRTDGYYEFEYVGLTWEDASKWLEKNKEKIELSHNGYFESYQGSGVHGVKLLQEQKVKRNE